MAHLSAQEHSSRFSQRQRTIALITVALAFVMDLLDNTIVNIAIPTIQHHLGASYATIQWLVAGYSLAFSLVLITGGRMGDVFGYKKLFMVGVAGFTLASLFSGLSTSSHMLIVARFLQGSMAALMVPQVMSLMQVMYKPAERGAINGMFGALGGAAASLGPVVGGLLIKANIAGLSWRPIFLINVPVGILAMLAGSRYLPEGKSAHPLKLDLIGTAIVVVGMLLLVYPLIEGRSAGWPAWTFLMLAASLPIFLLFTLWLRQKDKKDGSALVEPSLFKSRAFTAGLLINLIFEAVMLGFFLTNTLTIQIALGYSPIHAALTGLPVAVAIAMTMAVFGKALPKLGRKAPQIGTLIMAVGLVITSVIVQHYGYLTHSWQLIPGLFLIGVGMGFTFASLFAVVLSGVDVKHAGAASGVLSAVQQVGGAVGVAVIGVIFFGQISSTAPASFAAVKPQISQQLTASQIPRIEQKQIISAAQTCFVDRSKSSDSSVVPASCQSHGSADKSVDQAVQNSAIKANAANFSHSFRWTIIFGVVMLAGVAGLTLLLPKKFRPEAYQEI